jgi:hypothetical protein
MAVLAAFTRSSNLLDNIWDNIEANKQQCGTIAQPPISCQLCQTPHRFPNDASKWSNNYALYPQNLTLPSVHCYNIPRCESYAVEVSELGVLQWRVIPEPGVEELRLEVS